jgi:organic radical activating enzyme
VAVSGYITEIFRSIQGEGWYVGALQVFVRMSGCRLACRYCDTSGSKGEVPECAYFGPGGREEIENPIDVSAAANLIGALLDATPGTHSLSVTGGEPLEQYGFLAALLRGFRSRGLPVYLETNGLEKDGAREIAPLVDVVSLDIKLPSLCGGGDFYAVYAYVLPLFGEKELFCKVVLAEGFERGEFSEAVRLVAGYDPALPFVIQPASHVPGCGTVSGDELIELYMEASRYLKHVRVIPQCHHALGLF